MLSQLSHVGAGLACPITHHAGKRARRATPLHQGIGFVWFIEGRLHLRQQTAATCKVGRLADRLVSQEHKSVIKTSSFHQIEVFNAAGFHAKKPDSAAQKDRLNEKHNFID